MPAISRFFGIVIMMFYEDHNPPHFHAEFGSSKAIFDFNGNILNGGLNSKTATKLVREWVDLHQVELKENWELARLGKEIKNIEPLQ